MSWAAVVMDLPPGADISQLPDDYEPPPLGTREEVSAKVREVLPDVDFSDPSWGVIDGEDYGLEVNLGQDPEAVTSIGLRLTGGEGGFEVVARLLEQLSWRAVVLQSGDVYEPETARASFDAWRDWRDRVAGGTKAS